MTRHLRMTTGIVASCMLICSITAAPANAAVADCAALYNKKCHAEFKASDSSSHVDEYMNPKDVQQCILRGYDPPKGCRNNEGLSAGVRVEGSSGFSYGNIQAPENSPGKTGAAPTLGLNNMRMNLGFDWKGGCKIFGINLCADGKDPPAPLPTKIDLDHRGPSYESDRCPEKADPWGRLGGKMPLSPSGLSLGCGGTVPLSNYETTLNYRPNHIAVTEYGSYELRVYQKANGKYMLNPYYYLEYSTPLHPIHRWLGMLSLKVCTICMGSFVRSQPPMQVVTKRVLMRSLTGVIPLPGYLCHTGFLEGPSPEPMPQYMKSVELTPTIAQMITYNDRDTINLRLMSRNTIKRGYPMELFGLPEFHYYFYPEPPEDDPADVGEAEEKFLVLPVFNGLPVIPAGRVPSLPHIPDLLHTQVVVPAPGGMIPSGIMMPSPFYVPGISMESVPPPLEACGAEPFFFKKPAHLSGDILVEQPTTVCDGTEQECNAMKAKCEEVGGEDCDTISPEPINDLSCEVTKIPLNYPDVDQACDGMMQWVVLDRHNLVYPPGTSVTPIAIDGRTALMMPTNNKSRVFTQKDTNIRLGKDSPPITLQEGGTLLMSKGERLKMFPPATIDVRGVGPNGAIARGVVTLNGGGMLIDKYGVLEETFEPSTTPRQIGDPISPYIVNVNRSFDLPPDYEMPSQKKDGMMDPYVTLPQDPNPPPKIEIFKPKKNFTLPSSLSEKFKKLFNR